jgi:20S proteasome alpha/beta subunit
MSLEEATSTVLDILKSVMEEKVNANNTEIQILERKEKEDGSFEAVQRKIGEEELKTLLSQLEDSN